MRLPCVRKGNQGVHCRLGHCIAQLAYISVQYPDDNIDVKLMLIRDRADKDYVGTGLYLSQSIELPSVPIYLLGVLGDRPRAQVIT